MLMSNNEVIIRQIKSWTDYVKLINAIPIQELGEQSFRWVGASIYRGQSVTSWKLSSKLERNLAFAWPEGTTKNGKPSRPPEPDFIEPLSLLIIRDLAIRVA